MKINPPIVLTATLLLFMAGAGTLSAWLGYKMGHEALKGVTQPDVSPAKKLTQVEQSDLAGQDVQIILNEQELIQQAEAIIKGQSSPPPAPESLPDAEANSIPEAEPQAQLVNHEEDFSPIQGSDRGVTFAVMNTVEDDGTYLLDVSLKNNGAEDIRFLYSFLDIRNDQGRSISAVTEGLPGELPANGEWFSGTVSIPVDLLEDTQQLSLTLTDYPDQQLQLNLADIPVQY
ncbi:MAG: hypothetical protein F6J87_04810 [Spirulina sp. SIO3F2]|nr:hypothetical protein [Spirulina sp. SIO3F2]